MSRARLAPLILTAFATALLARPTSASADSILFSTQSNFNANSTGVDKVPLHIDVPADNPLLTKTPDARSSSFHLDDPTGNAPNALLIQSATSPAGGITPVPVPLPTSAYSGFSLLGGLGIIAGIRKRRSSR